ncbi:MAG: helix-turn-helix transcriptional regulator [Chitinophagales bacterium]|nr:helix-turn-helix transcriptional regulator [Chitinophagales bacterium]
MMIGKNIIRFRNDLGLSQEDLGRLVNKHQSTVSRIESDLQGIPYEEIPLFATALGKAPEDLLQTDSINLHIQTQNGGNANNYVVNHHSEQAVQAKDEIIALNKEIMAMQKARIAALESELELWKNGFKGTN